MRRRDFILQSALGGAAIFSGARTIAQAGPLLAAQRPSASPVAGGRGAVPLAPPDAQPPKLKIPEPSPRKIGWAIVGLGKLALENVLPAFGECKISQPVALVSGHADKARQVAKVYGIDSDAIYNYENFERLAENKRVDVVYIILPNSMHAEFTIRGCKAGKHVLCEKPMAVTVEESERMIVAAKEANRKLAIGYRLLHEPFNRRVIELCRKKEFGEIKTFSASNCQDVKAPNIRLSARLGGGPLGDVGVYCINAARYVIGEEPVEVSAFAHQPKDDPRFREVPESVAFIMRYPSGVLASCDCSFGTSESRKYRVHCAEGYIDLDPAFSYTGLRLHTKSGNAETDDTQRTELVLEPQNHFALEMDDFSGCILQNKETRTPGEMGLADMRIMAAIEEAIRSREPVHLGS